MWGNKQTSFWKRGSEEWRALISLKLIDVWESLATSKKDFIILIFNFPTTSRSKTYLSSLTDIFFLYWLVSKKFPKNLYLRVSWESVGFSASDASKAIPST